MNNNNDIPIGSLNLKQIIKRQHFARHVLYGGLQSEGYQIGLSALSDEAISEITTGLSPENNKLLARANDIISYLDRDNAYSDKKEFDPAFNFDDMAKELLVLAREGLSSEPEDYQQNSELSILVYAIRHWYRKVKTPEVSMRIIEVQDHLFMALIEQVLLNPSESQSLDSKEVKGYADNILANNKLEDLESAAFDLIKLQDQSEAKYLLPKTEMLRYIALVRQRIAQLKQSEFQQRILSLVVADKADEEISHEELCLQMLDYFGSRSLESYISDTQPLSNSWLNFSKDFKCIGATILGMFKIAFNQPLDDSEKEAINSISSLYKKKSSPLGKVMRVFLFKSVVALAIGAETAPVDRSRKLLSDTYSYDLSALEKATIQDLENLNKLLEVCRRHDIFCINRSLGKSTSTVNFIEKLQAVNANLIEQKMSPNNQAQRNVDEKVFESGAISHCFTALLGRKQNDSTAGQIELSEHDEGASLLPMKKTN